MGLASVAEPGDLSDAPRPFTLRRLDRPARLAGALQSPP
jgi:hypothetical protein